MVLAAIRHDLPLLRYITGKRDGRGMVVPGVEQIIDIAAVIVSRKKCLDQSRNFFRKGNFAAVLESVPSANQQRWPAGLFEVGKSPQPGRILRGLGPLRLPNRRQPLSTPRKRPAGRLAALCLPPGNARLGRCPGPGFPAQVRSGPLLARLLADLWANGLRRVRHHQYEDAILRAYRVLELVGQCRLFDHGLDSASLPPEEPHVQQLQEKLRKNKSCLEHKSGRTSVGVRAGRPLT